VRKVRYLFSEDQQPQNEESEASEKEGSSFEKQNVSELALDIIEDVQKHGSTNEQSSKLEELGDEEGEAESEESEDEHTAKNRQRLEEERAKAVLTRKEWDKNFDQA